MMPALSLAGTAISAGVGIMGSMQQAHAQAAAANYQAAVARNNAIIQQQNAAQAVATGRAQAQQQDLANAARLGALAAAQGASGIDIGSGTFRDVTGSAAQLGRLDTQNVMQRALQQARGYNVAAASETAQAGLEQMQAGQAQRAGVVGAGTSLLGGATSFADKWLRFQTTGVPGFGGGTAEGMPALGGYTPTGGVF
jgi:hypothetical protein